MNNNINPTTPNNFQDDRKDNKMKVTINFQDENGLNETLTLNSDQVAKFIHTADTIDKSYSETAVRVWERGCYDVEYRAVRNAKEYAAFKAFKAAQKGVKA